MTNTSKDASGAGSGGTNVTVNNYGPSLNPLYNAQGQKWQQVFDFEKVLKQLRSSEKNYLRNKGGSSDSHSKSTSSHSNVNIASSSNASSQKQVIQVQRLNAQDMQFYDVAPKQTARDVVVCNTCTGYFTKMGFNNHMMQHHPSVWSTVSSKLNLLHVNDSINLLNSNSAAENSQDSIREVTSVGQSADVVGSPMDMSGTISTSSNASSASSSMLSPYTVVSAPTTNSRHKSSSSKSSSTKTGSSSGSRSRSKSKHHHATSAAETQHSSHKNSNNNSKKSSTSTAVSTAAATTTSLNANSAGTASSNVSAKDSLTAGPSIYSSSSSSNSSSSLPSTPNMDAFSIVGASGNNVSSMLESGSVYSPLTSEFKDKHSSDSVGCTSLIASSKKKAKSPLVIAHESIDSSTSSTSSSEFDRITMVHKLKMQHLKATVKPISSSQLPPYDNQLSELDQAVSSITGAMEVSVAASNELGKLPLSNEAIAATVSLSQPTNSYPQQVGMIARGETELVAQQHNTSDENSNSLSLDDMLDSKFINEMLNTAESEIPFDESALDPGLQQPIQANYMQPPATKRMRFTDGAVNVANETHSTGTGSVAGEFVTGNYGAVYQQQTPYDGGNQIEDIKLYGNEMTTTGVEQPQLTTIDAMQLQQLIYQQQQMLEAAEQQKQINVDGYNTLSYDNQQLAANNVDGTTGQQFNVYNVPSLTDDNLTALPQQQQTPQQQLENMIMPSIIYEITANNQVAVMDQQSQQQVIAEFLTQAGYDNMEQMNVLSNGSENGQTAQVNSGVAANNSISNNDVVNGVAPTATSVFDINELCKFDFTKLETVTALSSTSTTAATATTPSTSELKTVKQETNLRNSHTGIQPHQRLTHTKNHEDFYFNVFLYAGIPRPIAINTYGMLKLPQSLAVTFRKHLLATRKANNSLLSLNGLAGVGGINGVIGGSAGVARFPLAGNAKQNFYVSSTGVVPGVSGTANEFSIGSITITNASGNSSGVPNLSLQTSLGGKNKAAPTALTVQPGTPTARYAAQSVASKTIYVNKSCIVANDRLKCIKRTLISKREYSKQPTVSTKFINDILNGGVGGAINKHVDLSNADATEQPQDTLDIKSQSTVQSFYERRRKLLLMSSSGTAGMHRHPQKHGILRQNSLRHPSTNHYTTQKQRQEKLLKKQLVRTLSGNDLMRVFV